MATGHTPPTLKEAKAFLSTNGVDFSDCFERCDLLERFAQVRISVERTAISRAKTKANAAFRRQSLEYAVRQYTDAALMSCALHPFDAAEAIRYVVLLLANRSQALLQLSLPTRALRDAQQCVRLDPSYVKGHARLAAACLALGQPHTSVAHLTRGLDAAANAPEEQQLRRLLQVQLESALEASKLADGDEAAEIAAAASAKEEREAREAEAQADCIILQRLDEDLLTMILCHLTSEADLAAAACACHPLRRAVASPSAQSCWHALCMQRWPSLSSELHTREEGLRNEASNAMRSMLGETELEDRTLALDWHVLLRERERHKKAWESGRATYSAICTGNSATLGTNGGSAMAQHHGPVYGCMMVGDTLLTSSEDATLKVWDLATNTPTLTCEGHDHGILGAWISSDGKRAVSGGFDSTIRVWDLNVAGPKGKCQRIFVGHSGPIVSVQCTSDRVYSTSFDGTCRVWDFDGKSLATLQAHDGHASGLSLHNDGTRVLTGGDDGLLKEFDLETQSCISTRAGHEGAVWSVRSYGPHTICTGATDGSLCMYDLRKPIETPTYYFKEAHYDAIAGLQLDDVKVLTSSFDSTVKIWDLRMLGGDDRISGPNGAGIMGHRATLHAPNGTRCTRLAFDDTRIVTGSLHGTVVSFDLL